MEASELRRELQRQMINDTNMEERMLRQQIKNIENGQIMRGEAIGYFGGRGDNKAELRKAHKLAALHNPFVEFMKMYGLDPMEAAQLYQGMGYGTKLGAVHNPYLEFEKVHHTRKGYNKESKAHLSEHEGGRRRRGGTAAQKKAAKNNKWLQYVAKHRKKGLTLKQISKKYHAKKGGAVSGGRKKKRGARK